MLTHTDINPQKKVQYKYALQKASDSGKSVVQFAPGGLIGGGGLLFQPPSRRGLIVGGGLIRGGGAYWRIYDINGILHFYRELVI